MSMTRLWEKLTGMPHQRHLADSVSAATAGLLSAARSVNERLAPYKNAPDPFTAVMADLYEKRQEANLHRGDK